MRRKKILYHVTEPKNVESIMRFGLRREGWCVYMSTKPLSWYRDGLRILRVDISGLSQVKANTFLPDSDEVLWWGEIPSMKRTKSGEYVSRITDVTENYIDKKTLIKVIQDKSDFHRTKDAMRIAELEAQFPKEGEWKKILQNGDGTSDYECSACLGIIADVPDDDEHPLCRFCPNCGAKMDGAVRG